MAYVSLVPLAQVDPGVQDIMRVYDKEYAGSEFLRAFAHAPKVLQSFVQHYFPLIFTITVHVVIENPGYADQGEISA